MAIKLFVKWFKAHGFGYEHHLIIFKNWTMQFKFSKLKFFVLLLCPLLASEHAHSQLLGPTPLGNYYTDQGIMTLNSWLARTSIGACWGGQNTLWGGGYVGFNLAHDGNQQQPWTYLGDGANNGGGTIYTDVGGSMKFATMPTTGGQGGSLSNDDIRAITRMSIDKDGKVCIGTGFFQNQNATKSDGVYKLYVEGGILTEKVRVAVGNSNEWADFVFNKNYRLMPLPQLRNYLAANNHLPGVPSASEVVEKGVDLQKMDATLLQKVEELTLYVLQQQKEIEELKVRLGKSKAGKGR